MNNPLKYTDPDGEWVHLAIGAVIGGLQGYNIGKQAGLKGWKLIAATIAGAGIGAATGGIANGVATSGAAFAQTTAIAVGSHFNSIGMMALGSAVGVEVPYNLSIGVASITASSNGIEFGYLGKKGNSFMQNLGYGLGAFANISDVYGFAKGAYANSSKPTGDVSLTTKNDPIGHNALIDENGNTLVSVGPDKGNLPPSNKDLLLKSQPNGTNRWDNYSVDVDKFSVTKIDIKNVRVDKINNFANSELQNFNYGIFKWNGYSCVSACSKALLQGGVFNIPFLGHPSILQLQMVARQNAYLSYQFQNF